MSATRMKRLPVGVAALTILLILSACASQIMKSYIGAPISSVMLDYGPPDNVYDHPSRRPKNSPASSTSTPAGNGSRSRAVQRGGEGYASGQTV